MNILVIGGFPLSLIIFRGHLLRAMASADHSVTAAANGRDAATERALKSMGVQYHPIRLSRAGVNPFYDLITLWDLIRLMLKVRPDIVLSYTIKPVVYSGTAAQLLGIRNIYSMITGLGYAFTEYSSILHRVVSALAKSLYRASLKRSRRVFFQNPEDLALFVDHRLVRPNQTVLINGSGVDVEHYAFSALPDDPIFLMIARLLSDKGVREYAAAAAIVKQRFPKTRFLLAGDLDPNPSAIQEEELREWKKSQYIEYLGRLDDVRPFIESSRYYVLPSYREGTPRTVLEAMSMGRPVITTDVPGCRETVVLSPEGLQQKERGESILTGENGFLVKARDVDSLKEAILQFILHPDLAPAMAKYGREIAETRYDVHKVNTVILEAMGLL